MATLFDELQKKLGQKPAAAPSANQQSTIASVLAAKSGKAGGAGGVPAASTVQQDVAQDAAASQQQQANQNAALVGVNIGQAVEAQQQQTQTQQNALNTQGQIANQQLATQAQGASEATQATEDNANTAISGQEERTIEQSNAKAENVLRDLASERGITVDNIFREFQRSDQELEFRKDAAELEQRGFLLAMRDKAYLDELNRIAAERDLEDKMNYKDEMTRLVLGDQLDRLMDDIGFKTLLNADKRTWDERLAAFDDETAIAAAEAAIRDGQRNNLASAAGDAAKVGVDYYYKNNTTKSETPKLDKMEQQDSKQLIESGKSTPAVADFKDMSSTT